MNEKELDKRRTENKDLIIIDKSYAEFIPIPQENILYIMPLD